VSGETVTVTDMQVDVIFATAGGDFSQSMPADFSAMTASINQTTGAMTFTPTDRTGSISAPNSLYDLPWNVDDVTVEGNTEWAPFTTGTATNATGSVTGAPIIALGDINGDTLTDYNVILVSASRVGTLWGSFAGVGEFETWNIDMLSVSPRAVDDNAPLTEFTSLTIDVLANDGGTPPLAIIRVTQGTLGTVSIDAGNTSVTYTSTGGLGDDSFTYDIEDGDGNIDTATVTVQVSGSPVIANDDNAQTKQEQLVGIDVIENDTTSAAGETIDGSTVSILTQPSNGAVQNNLDGTIDYTPDPGFVGADSITYDVEDTAGNLSSSATVSFAVSAAPVLSSGTFAPGTGASDNGQISAGALPQDPGATAYCVGGCYSYIITGAANPTTIVMVQLNNPVPQNATMRKYNGAEGGNFDTSAGDNVSSAPLSGGGGCPGIGDPSWVLWNGAQAGGDTVGHECLQFVVTDNGVGPGPNDLDPNPGTIEDPVGISTFVAENDSDQRTLDRISDDGCSIAGGGNTSAREHMDWMLVLVFLSLLSMYRLRQGRS
jgi:hypothetical protein